MLDANLIVRVLTQDVPEMAKAAQVLFDRIQAGQEEIEFLEATVAEVVYVLGSPAMYNLPRGRITELLRHCSRHRDFAWSTRRGAFTRWRYSMA